MVTTSASCGPDGAPYRRTPFGRLVIAATLAALAVAFAGGFDAGAAISILDRPTARTVWILLDVLRMPAFLGELRSSGSDDNQVDGEYLQKAALSIIWCVG